MMIVVLGAVFSAQSNARESASYQNLETVEVTAKTDKKTPETGSSVQFSAENLTFLVPVSLTDVLPLVPSVNIRTNSRGEALATIRGSGERQLALFWNDIPANVPWDNRFDLNLIPALAIDTIKAHAGTTAPGFGPNTAGGVIEVASAASGVTALRAFRRTGDSFGLDGATAFSGETVQTLVAASYFDSEGRPSPTGSTLFSAEENGLITNTDRRLASVAANSSFQFGGSRARLSVLYSDAAFGVAPEQGDRIDPAAARYWRFPDSRHLLVAGNWEALALGSADLVIHVWYQEFDQIIQSFTGNDFAEIDSTQEDENSTYGARVLNTWQSAQSTTALSATAIWSRHLESGSGIGNQGASDKFSHFSGGIAVDHRQQLDETLSISMGVGYDRLSPDKTGGRPDSGAFDGWNASLNLEYQASTHWSLRVGAAHKVRLPTMRELFGVALGRFLLNPDLEAEKSWLLEASADYRWGQGVLTLTPFWVEIDDTLEQARVNVDGVSLRQRINLPGSRIYGLESRLVWHPSSAFSVAANATWSRSRAKRDSVANSLRRLYLSDRPNWLARLDAQYQLGPLTTFGLSVDHRGAARSEDVRGEFLELEPATTVDLWFRQSLGSAPDGSGLELFAQLENLTDAFVEPQLGLPDPGRRVTLGIKAVF